MRYTAVLFDLDGTLTDPKEGITKSVAHALHAFGIEADPDTLCGFIGPPLTEGFERFYGFSHEDAVKAVDIYRERFRPVGMYENRVYDGIPALLRALHTAGVTVAVATSKPQIFAASILEHFGLMPDVDILVGSELDGTRVQKADVVREVLCRLTVAQRQHAVMVGDRSFDVDGAAALGLPCIGVSYGYGSREELCKALAVADSVEELTALLLA